LDGSPKRTERTVEARVPRIVEFLRMQYIQRIDVLGRRLPWIVATRCNLLRGKIVFVKIGE
jgi:hypothetical protein